MKKYILLFVFLAFSCQKEEITESQPLIIQKTPSLENVKSNFSNYNRSELSFFEHGRVFLKNSSNANQQARTTRSLDNSMNNFKIDWKASDEKAFKEGVNFLYTPINNNLMSRSKTILASVLIDGKIETYSYTMVYDSKSTDKQFSGYIFKHDVKGAFVSAYHYESGKNMETFIMNATNENKSYASFGFNFTSLGCSCTTSIFEIVWSIRNGISPENILDCVCVNGTAGGNFGGSNNSRGNSRNSWSEPSNSLRSGNNDHGGGGNFGSSGASSGGDGKGDKLNMDGVKPWWSKDKEDVEDKIIDELTGKAKCLNDLLDEKGNSYVKDILSKFKGDDSEFHIIIKSVDKLINPETLEERAGITRRPNSSNEIIIEISNSISLQNPAFEVAKTILHEYIHADIYRKLLTRNTPIEQDILDFRDTFAQYKEQFKNEIATTQHQTMGYLYVNSMRDALKAFHKDILKADYNKYVNYLGHEPTDLFYEALAWRGLKEHNVEAYIDINPEKIKQLEAVDLDIDVLTKGCKNAQ